MLLETLATISAAGASAAGLRYLWRKASGEDAQRQIAELEVHARVAIARAQAEAQALTPAAAPHTYAPTIHYTHAPRITGTSSSTTEHAALIDQAAPVPTFAELLHTGAVGPGNPLILGYTASGPLYGDWKDLYSTGIGGISGSGKSWTAAYLLAQSVLHGAKVAILDPHAGNGESLSTRLGPLTGRFLCEVADTPRTMLDVVKLVQAEIDSRIERKEKRQHWIIVADEWSSLMRGELAGPLAGLFEAIAQEGRKYHVYGMALGQVWQTSRSGGSEVRDSLASAYLHRLRPRQAGMLAGMSTADLPKDLLELPPGSAYLLSTGGDLQRVTVPHCTAQDVQQVAGLLSDNHPTMPRAVVQDGAGTATGQHQDSSAQQTSSAQERRILDLYASGKGVNDIVRDVKGIDPAKGGRKVQEARAEVEAVIRAALKGGAR